MQFLRNLLRIPIDYLNEIAWEYNQAEGVFLAKATWHAGGLSRLGAALSLILLIVGAIVIEKYPPEITEVPLPPIVWVGLAGMVLGWAYGMAAGARAGLWIYLVVCAYLNWFGLFVAGSLAGTPWFALLALWSLYIGWRMVSASHQKTRWFVLLILCLGVGYITFNPLFGRYIPAVWRVQGQWCSGLVCFILLAWLLCWRQRGNSLPVRFVFWGTIFIAGGVYMGAWLRDPETTAQTIFLVSHEILGLADLFWLWLGWTALEWALDMGSWGTEKAAGVLPDRMQKWFFPLIWFGVCFVSWLTTHPLPPFLATRVVSSGFQSWVNSWSLQAYWSLYWMMFVSLAALICWLILRAVRRLSVIQTGYINGLWVAAWLGLYGFFTSLAYFDWLEQDADPGLLTTWTAILLVGGLAWELIRAWPVYFGGIGGARAFSFLAYLSWMLAITVVLVGAGSPSVTLEYTLFGFLGLIYLGVPLMLLTIWDRSRETPLLEHGQVFLLLVAGALSAVFVMGIDPWPGLVMGLAPFIWCIIFIWLTWRRRVPESLGQGLVMGGLLGLGFVVFWMAPQPLPVPFLSFLNEWQFAYTSIPLNRPILQAGQLWMTLAAMIGGAGIGGAAYLVNRLLRPERV